jgi:hypothetical protein
MSTEILRRSWPVQIVKSWTTPEAAGPSAFRAGHASAERLSLGGVDGGGQSLVDEGGGAEL